VTQTVNWYAYDFADDRALAGMSQHEIVDWVERHDDEYSSATILVRDRDVLGESKRVLIQWEEEDGEESYQLYFPSFDADVGTAENWTFGSSLPTLGRTKLLFVYCGTNAPEDEPYVLIGVSSEFDDGTGYEFIIVSEPGG
jgi:hypothetical protein